MSEYDGKIKRQQQYFQKTDANQLIPTLASYQFQKIKVTADFYEEFYSNNLCSSSLKNQNSQIDKRIKKYEILETLINVQLESDMNCGFCKQSSPNKEWAENIFNIINPNHQFCQKYEPEKFE